MNIDRTQAAAWDTSQRLWIPVQVGAGGYERYDKPVEVTLNFTQLLDARKVKGDFDNRALRMVEVDPDGAVVDEAVHFQFNRAANYNTSRNAQGTLIFLLNGRTSADAVRHFRVHFDPTDAERSPIKVSPQVILTEGTKDEGQESFKIVTQNATYYYHKFGAGFSSLIDADGRDWISYRPGDGSAGEYRGIPNMGYPEGYCHPGHKVSDSRIVAQGPLCVSILSESNDGKMQCRWDIFPYYARLTVLKMRPPYWFLYEGTPGGNPGGRLDEENGFCVRSTAQRTPLSQAWTSDIPDPEWLYFGAGNTKRVLYLIHHEDDDATDSYWPMEQNMTVFGFGRSGLEKFMERVPAHFTVGFAEDGTYETAAQIIDAAFRDLNIHVGSLQQS